MVDVERATGGCSVPLCERPVSGWIGRQELRCLGHLIQKAVATPRPYLCFLHPEPRLDSRILLPELWRMGHTATLLADGKTVQVEPSLWPDKPLEMIEAAIWDWKTTLGHFPNHLLLTHRQYEELAGHSAVRGRINKWPLCPADIAMLVCPYGQPEFQVDFLPDASGEGKWALERAAGIPSCALNTGTCRPVYGKIRELYYCFHHLREKTRLSAEAEHEEWAAVRRAVLLVR